MKTRTKGNKATGSCAHKHMLCWNFPQWLGFLFLWGPKGASSLKNSTFSHGSNENYTNCSQMNQLGFDSSFIKSCILPWVLNLFFFFTHSVLVLNTTWPKIISDSSSAEIPQHLFLSLPQPVPAISFPEYLKNLISLINLIIFSSSPITRLPVTAAKVTICLSVLTSFPRSYSV